MKTVNFVYMNRMLNFFSVVGMHMFLFGILFWSQRLTIGMLPVIKTYRITDWLYAKDFVFIISSIIMLKLFFRIKKPHIEN